MFRISLVECPSSYVNKYIGIRLSFIRVSGTLIYRKWGIFASKEKPSQKWLFAVDGLSCWQIRPPGEAAVGPLPPSVVGLHISNWWKKKERNVYVFIFHISSPASGAQTPLVGCCPRKSHLGKVFRLIRFVSNKLLHMWQLPSVLGVTISMYEKCYPRTQEFHTWSLRS